MKKVIGYVIILHIVPIIIIIWCMFPDIWSAPDIRFCHFGSLFTLFPHYWPQKWKFGKNVKTGWSFYPFTCVYHKWRSNDVWFLRYKVWQEFFVILGHFLPFDPPNNPEHQNFEKWKKCQEISSFYTILPKIMIICYTVP